MIASPCRVRCKKTTTTTKFVMAMENSDEPGFSFENMMEVTMSASVKLSATTSLSNITKTKTKRHNYKDKKVKLSATTSLSNIAKTKTKRQNYKDKKVRLSATTLLSIIAKTKTKRQNYKDKKTKRHKDKKVKLIATTFLSNIGGVLGLWLGRSLSAFSFRCALSLPNPRKRKPECI